ncbi:LpxI family protein [Falsihalocynthiibacter sp. S25ZX9]|uniref:LpxI family protein n=1 Tax=unclassified Falsihalocynthiibacter TaxID=2854191 RepID=UPI00350EDDCE
MAADAPNRLAVLAGRGDLPLQVAAREADSFVVTFQSVETNAQPDYEARFEKLGGLFKELHKQGVKRVCFAGGLRRPALNPLRFDATMMRLAPRLIAAMKGGDDHILRIVVEVFEDAGFTVVGAHEICPEILATEGLIAGEAPSEQALRDMDRAHAILTALSPVDVGQGCVVANGLCYGIETIQGTDAMLSFIAQNTLSRQGVLMKRAKVGQELRVDMPAIGPETLHGAHSAGLAGVVVQAGQVMIVDPVETCALAKELGLFIYGEAR